MKIAIVHDYLNQMGGAERLVAAMHEAWPEAPIYTSIYDRGKMPKVFSQMDIRTTFMQRLPFVIRHWRPYLMVYPMAFEQLDLSEYDVVLSSTTSYAKGVITRPQTCHICYCNTPMRFVWTYEDYIKREKFSLPVRVLLPPLINYLRLWDQIASTRVDYYIANSENIKRRIQKFYHQDAKVIYPFVHTQRFKMAPEQDNYFLIVSRLSAYKRIDIPVKVFSRLNLPLWIIGSGPEEENLKKMAGPSVRFLGRVPDAEMAAYYARCIAFVHPGEEDFGITPLEAQASGRPVIAYAGGGALETIKEGETGCFFKAQTEAALTEVVKHFDVSAYDPVACRAWAQKFSKERFIQELKSYVDACYKMHLTTYQKLH